MYRTHKKKAIICSGYGDVPLFLRVADGNEADSAVFAEIMQEFKHQLNFDTLISRTDWGFNFSYGIMFVSLYFGAAYYFDKTWNQLILLWIIS